MCREHLLAAMFLFLSSCAGPVMMESADDRPVIEPWIGDGEYAILIDTIHQWEGRPDFVFDEKEFRYCHSQSVARLMGNLVATGFRYRQIREGALTSTVLDGHDVVLINVPTAVRGGRSRPDGKFPRIRQREIDALVRYVEQGGGLFVVAEHNNAYDNAVVLNPLLKHFGVQVPAAYAIERPWSKESFDSSGCQIAIWNYESHPVTRKLRATSWLGGAPLTTKNGIAFLSKHGHVDLGNFISHKPSRFSNRKVDPGEYKGPGIPVIAAVEKGKGRVVVIGDHNMLGMQWLGVADNYRFAMNVFAWLAKRENETPHIADLPPKEVILGVDLSHSEWHIGSRDRMGYHAGFLNLSRHPDLFPRGLLSLDDPADVYVFLDPTKVFSKDDLRILDGHLQRGKRLILLCDPGEPQVGSMSLLSHYFADVAITTPKGEIFVQQLRQGKRSPIPRLQGAPVPSYSDQLGMDGIRIGALKPKSYKGRGRHRVPRKVSAGKPYLLDLKIDVGQPFVTARTSSGHEITIARRVRIGNGEIILIPQARMWNNETMGTMRDEPFNETGRGAFTFQMRLIDWLSKRPPVADAGNGEAFNHSVEFGSGDATGAGDGEGFKTGGDSASHLVKAN